MATLEGLKKRRDILNGLIEEQEKKEGKGKEKKEKKGGEISTLDDPIAHPPKPPKP